MRKCNMLAVSLYVKNISGSWMANVRYNNKCNNEYGIKVLIDQNLCPAAMLWPILKYQAMRNYTYFMIALVL